MENASDEMTTQQRSSTNDTARLNTSHRLVAVDINADHGQHLETKNETVDDSASGEVESDDKAAGQANTAEVKDKDRTVVDLAVPASSRALKTNEILGTVLSFLPVADLINASNVNKTFYNCVFQCHATQETLFLRPSDKPLPQCYIVKSIIKESGGGCCKFQTLALTPSAGLQIEDRVEGSMYPFTAQVPAVRLCPGLQAVSKEVALATPPGLIKQHRTSFFAHPDDMGRLSNMLLTDPPPNEATVHLCYRWTSADWFFAVSTSQVFQQNDPLTLSRLVEGVSLARADVWREYKGKYRSPSTRTFDVLLLIEDTSLEAETARYVRRHGASFSLDLERSWVEVGGYAFCPEEWESMCDDLAREEVRKKCMGPEAYSTWLDKLFGRDTRSCRMRRRKTKALVI